MPIPATTAGEERRDPRRIGTPASGRPSPHALIASLFIAAAILLGGGGTPSPASETALQLTCALAALAWVWVPNETGAIMLPRDRLAWLVVALVLALPVLQLIPVPPALWSALPGQESRVAALALVGQAESWQPLARSPARTLAALLAMVPPLFAFVAVATLDQRGRFLVIATIAGVTLVSALLGIVQVTLGEAAPYFHEDGHRPFLTGFQANRNAQADVLLIGGAATCFCVLPALLAGKPRGGAQSVRHSSTRATSTGRTSRWWLLGAVLGLFLLGVVLTGSRAGIALIGPTLLGICLMLRPAIPSHGPARLALVALVLLGLAMIGALALQASNTPLGRATARFALSGDFRAELWRDTGFAIAQSWPVGVGLGGFQPAMMAAERLEVLDPTLPNRAHNDYLELALEGGLVGILLLVATMGLIGWRALAAWRQTPARRAEIVLSGTILLIVAGHSFVDYPLRSMALACLTGTGAALVMRPGGTGRQGSTGPHRRNGDRE